MPAESAFCPYKLYSHGKRLAQGAHRILGVYSHLLTWLYGGRELKEERQAGSSKMQEPWGAEISSAA